ncbi:MAG: hypothetical protein K0Q95_1606 [Bacteroidota bacterium]|jgi:hypothetical protein|nr:hypothetical protein [Bacteroidota bacterium]
MLKRTLLLVLVSIFALRVNSQCTTSISAGTPTSTSTCYDFDAASQVSASSPCTGSGFGGAGQRRVISFCTNASNTCVTFALTGLNSGGGTSIALYTGCSGTTLSGYVTGSANCYSSATTANWSTAGLGLTASTCYYLSVWTANAPASTSTLCTQTLLAPNDYCTGASAISTVSQSFNNYCMTAGSNGSYTEPPASQFDAGSLENNAWYTFTTLSTCTYPCTVTISITGISCSGGGSGFQIGFWSGSCTSLTNLGNTSGSGGTVTATITNLSPNQSVYVGIDGNAGAFCSFSLSATNVIPLPIELIKFDALSKDDIAEIFWITASETNNDYFTVDKSHDAVNWETVGIYKSKSPSGNSTSSLNYSVSDDKPYPGTSYYRLKQTDFNGDYEYSDLVTLIRSEDNDIINVRPNPTQNSAEISYKCAVDGTAFVNVYDYNGKLIISKNIECVKGTNLSEIQFNDQPNGMYFVTISTNNKLYKTKILKTSL